MAPELEEVPFPGKSGDKRGVFMSPLGAGLREGVPRALQGVLSRRNARRSAVLPSFGHRSSCIQRCPREEHRLPRPRSQSVVVQ